VQAECVGSIRSPAFSRMLVRRPSDVPKAAAPQIDAVVIPTIRPVANLDYAISLVGELGASLVAMCSGSARAEEIDIHATRGEGFSIIGVQLPENFSHPLLSFTSSLHADAARGRQSDLSLKRNLTLLLGRAVGWRRLLFLDDDVRDISTDDLRRASHMLPKSSAVGFFVDEFPDHSVLGHALRLAQAPQQTFVSGGALLVDPSAPIPFFPDIYNEDWLFLHDWTQRGQVASAGNARQLAYFPFDIPDRAYREEFGDLLAEGLYQLIYENRDWRIAGTDFWATQILERRQRIVWALEALHRSPVDAHLRERVRTALAAALARLDQIEPSSPGRFIDAWRDDLQAWEIRCQKLQPFNSVAAALKHFGLTATIDFRASREETARLLPIGRII
jgi:hypothetical protein